MNVTRIVLRSDPCVDLSCCYSSILTMIRILLVPYGGLRALVSWSITTDATLIGGCTQ